MANKVSKSLEIAKQFLGKEVEIVFDRPLGSKHPKWGFIYETNYGYIEGVQAPDGEELDAYYLGTDQTLERVKGTVKAIIHRLDDDDDKLVVMPKDFVISDVEIEKAVNFQEKWFKHEILRSL
ncbi:MAG: inorganic pyrophosphatase [Patescibacteria group bacterium]|jgi:inorganic pyrophosphatase